MIQSPQNQTETENAASPGKSLSQFSTSCPTSSNLAWFSLPILGSNTGLRKVVFVQQEPRLQISNLSSWSELNQTSNSPKSSKALHLTSF